jgi:acyl-CoA thioesterase FadM
MWRWWRLLLIYISSIFRKKIRLTDISDLSFRVWPQETDKKYMNNASFWTITEMGQMDFLFRTGLFKLCRRHHWYPLVGSQKMVYKKPLKRFERFQLRSQVTYCDDKWLYIEQTFLKNDQLIANGLVKVIFRGKNGNVPVSQVLTSLGTEVNLPRESLIDDSENIDKKMIARNEQ